MDEDDGSHPELSEDSPHSNNAELVFESNVSSLAWILNYMMTSQAICSNKTASSGNDFRMLHLIGHP